MSDDCDVEQQNRDHTSGKSLFGGSRLRVSVGVSVSYAGSLAAGEGVWGGVGPARSPVGHHRDHHVGHSSILSCCRCRHGRAHDRRTLEATRHRRPLHPKPLRRPLPRRPIPSNPRPLLRQAQGPATAGRRLVPAPRAGSPTTSGSGERDPESPVFRRCGPSPPSSAPAPSRPLDRRRFRCRPTGAPSRGPRPGASRPLTDGSWWRAVL